MIKSVENLAADEKICLHCGQEVPLWRKKLFCCLGCETVHHLLKTSQLDNFYRLKPIRINPLINYFQRKQKIDWVSSLAGYSSGQVLLKMEGIQCAACIWAVREIGKRLGPVDIQIDSVAGQMSVRFDAATYPLQIFLERIQELGYRTSPLDSAQREFSSPSLLLRLGLCASISMVTMCMAAGLYFGLDKTDPLLYQLSVRLNYYVSIAAVAIGGSYFFHRAYLGLKNGILHFDLPVAIGILFAFVGSVYSYYNGVDEGQYFDSLTGFITLMLAGRYAQERFLVKNRQQLLGDHHLSQLTVTKITEEGPREYSFHEISKGDHLLLQSGSILPVPAFFDEAAPMMPSEFSLAWINGESIPVIFDKSDQLIPAGSCYLGSSAVQLVAAENYQNSLLNHLTPVERSHEMLPVAWQKAVKYYVVGVLLAAAMAFLFWAFQDLSRAVLVTTAILVITCPCSLGLAIPLARIMANRRMASWGLFARDGALLDKWLEIRKVFFDKTGTLTLAGLKLLHTEDVDRLNPQWLEIIFNMSSRSRHPASSAISHYLTPRQFLWNKTLHVVEQAGKGLSLDWQGVSYFLGKNDVRTSSNEYYEVVFKVDGETKAVFKLAEDVLEGAAATFEQLKKMGVSTYQLSGDKQSHVWSMGQKLGLSRDRSMGDLSPAEKAFRVRQLSNNDSLYLGDGLNDSRAFQESLVCGAPVWEKSIMAHHADFYFLAGNLHWLPKMFQLSKQLRHAIRFNFYFAAFYNLSAVAMAMLGWITPLMAAVLMPVSSIVILLITLAMMKGERA